MEFSLLDALKSYKPWNQAEVATLVDTIDFVRENSDWAERTNLAGHVTGAAWIVNQDLTKILLIKHHKSGLWMQPGGHSDGDQDTFAVAYRELTEETGLQKVVALGTGVFDIDIHDIPARGDVSEHKHYDVRFLFQADDSQELIKQEAEVDGIKWFTLEEANEFAKEAHISRMIEKTIWFANSQEVYA